ncbi:MAG: AbrB/MazE/SpoVT family DNA-binding domain-containing protein [Acidimicrobiia bacterium]
MRTTIDGAGRIVVPKALRDSLNLTGGTEVELVEHDGTLEVRAVVGEFEIVETPEGPVMVSNTPGPPLTDDDVRATLERVRR